MLVCYYGQSIIPLYTSVLTEMFKQLSAVSRCVCLRLNGARPRLSCSLMYLNIRPVHDIKKDMIIYWLTPQLVHIADKYVVVTS